MTIKAITFDFWSTLYRSAPVDYAQRLRHLQQAVEQGSGATFEPEQFKAAVTVARDAWTQIWVQEFRTMPANEWLAIMLSELGISLRPEHLRSIQLGMEESVLEDGPTLVPEARAVLSGLSTRYRLGIISDTGLTPGRVLRRLLAQDQILGYFTRLTFSDEVGYSKPHPTVFLATLDALQAEPQAAVHVGDLIRTDIAGAQGVGMRAVQYIGVNEAGSLSTGDAPAAGVRPDAVIQNYTQLLPLLQQWNGLPGS
ncbi:MAG: HAD family hydrolase [Chloroflexota bacterium]